MRKHLTELLHGACDFPRCTCGQKLCAWTEVLDRLETEGPDFEVLADMRLHLFLIYKCITAHCSDPRWRDHATVKLLNPIYSRLEGSRWH
jgi:hypothetical protein